MTENELRKKISDNLKRREKMYERYLHMSPGEKRATVKAELEEMATKHIAWSQELAKMSRENALG